ncbi:hypothetical protein RND81_12G122500 [Saponaria officinalis]|uniref:IREH1/IRE-like N-terminal domain-containing protein n=1 Tax=Saponaria officinalis TaxID=3572 RepID=A0AAW1H9L6_SAPOF
MGNASLINQWQSPELQAILGATSGRKKRTPDIRPHTFRKSPVFLYTEATTVMIREKFNKLKDEVDSDLGIFAGDLVGILEKSTESNPDWSKGLDDLLLIARQCAAMSTDELWHNCESIVQDLNDRRQDLPTGGLKRAYTRLLYILSRYTRPVQFQKEGGFQNEHIQKDEPAESSRSQTGNSEPPTVERVPYCENKEQQRTYQTMIICRICEFEIPAMFVENLCDS